MHESKTRGNTYYYTKERKLKSTLFTFYLTTAVYRSSYQDKIKCPPIIRGYSKNRATPMTLAEIWYPSANWLNYGPYRS